ncbi:O-antigen ligase-like membrane protein [Diaminobutyricimonas aerilata]|uniref:O-antigen ligase-like membrane protein n=1 Tax=Diaminobutyricimonas aerilata TaxID=1162967 RepID=A0A2M9CH38_9MICO|nr:O-antigen ligase family protein [Diaminobutyricimonas aerilata]PJJ71236.1 O-antigen ligase-like membrane protein [Diaminobutyricimonas aerilata]
MIDRAGYRGVLATLILFTVSAGDFWRNSISWAGWATVCLVLLGLAAVELVRERPTWRGVPVTLWLFLGFAGLSLIWSFYPGATALALGTTAVATVGAFYLAFCLDWAAFVRALDFALRWVLGLSLVFEAIAAVIVRAPVLPFFPAFDPEQPDLPRSFYWSRALLLDGGRIQGIVGNANLLSMLALLALIVFSIRLVSGAVRRRAGITWIVVAVAVLALTRSSTVIVAAVVVVLALALLLLVRRLDDRARLTAYAVTAVLAVGGIVGAIAGREALLRLLGRSSDLTNRLDIWSAVTDLAVQRPVGGWGWVSYWVPWVEPFDDLVVIRGVTYLQAHNAWLDLWFQVGVIGAVLFATLALSAFVRAWWQAAHRPRLASGAAGRFTTESVLPVLLLTALLVQSFAESRLLTELGWVLLVTLAVRLKADRRRTAA